jgi:predicted sugar kinase
MTILNQIESSIIVGGDQKMAYSFDINTHELIDVWAIGAIITAVACVSLEDGGFIVACGTSEGKIAI